ncbi:MAG: methionine adenosyltransferase [Bacteroidota bacterium]|nr:methionine adenosyltransferase [Bacteroidota bacterium]
MVYQFTSESVSEGHPDKICDQISDAILDEIMRKDTEARVACECFVTTGFVLVGGEITTHAHIDIQDVVRDTIRLIGYEDADLRFDADSCGIANHVKRQSPDIARGLKSGGAGDQGMMFGYATRQTPEYMPLPIMLAHKLVKRLAELRKAKNSPMPYLRPDAKSQVTMSFEGRIPRFVQTVVISTQHADHITQKRIREDVIEHVIYPVIPEKIRASNMRIHVNPTGRFVIGGPYGDAGLTGRKIIVDTYGGWAPHGGGAFSGKDPSKVDRSGAYAARHIAKNVVAAGLADECTIQVSYAIGIAKPVSIHVDTHGTAKEGLTDRHIASFIAKNIDLTPNGIIERLKLRRPIYRETAAYGHFGRTGNGFTWEKLDLVDLFRQI